MTATEPHRCAWAQGEDPLMARYHDEVWGVPQHDARMLWEMLVLEGFQAGLSWRTILHKREAFRRAFAGFDFREVARYTGRDVERLLADAGIVRHRGKIESTINNARRTCDLVDEVGSLAAFVWRYEPAAAARPKRITAAGLAAMAATPESTALSKALKQRGFSFVGPTTMYAFMQAMGLVNDHVEGCPARAPAARARERFRVPQAKA
jgi:DNA-3-methyladenine glycosylase I